MLDEIRQTLSDLSYQPQWTPKQKWEILLRLYPNCVAFQDRREQYQMASDQVIHKFHQFSSQLDRHQLEKLEKVHGIHSLTILDSEYPDSLKEIYDPPLTLFYQGDLSILHKGYRLAVVGSRRHSDYGPKAMRRTLSYLMPYNDECVIVSGLALGIDGLAHQFALENRMHTIGVVGNGLDINYPKANQVMQNFMKKNHLLLSEYPAQASPMKHHFPQRNRIVVGLSRGIYVVEARKRSGSLITAYRGVDENRDIFVTPASILDPHFEGSNRLLQLGAIPIIKGDEIASEWKMKNKMRKK